MLTNGLLEDAGSAQRARRPQTPAKLCAAFSKRLPQPELRALARAERGSVYWLHALMPVFYMELWHTLGNPAALAALRQAVFVA